MGNVGAGARRRSVVVAVVAGLVLQLVGVVGLGAPPAGAGVLQLADLSLGLEAPASVVEGEPIAVVVTVANAGPADVNRATVQLSVPDGVDVVADEASTCALQAPGAIRCDLDVIEHGSQRQHTLELAGATVGTLTVDGTVTALGYDDPSRVGGNPAGNDLASVSVEVIPTPSRLTIDLTELDGLDPVPAGDPLAYSIVVRQEGGSTAAAPVATFAADPSTPILAADVVAADPYFTDPRPEVVSPCVVDGDTGSASCTLPDLGHDEAGYVLVTVAAPAVGTVAASASVDDPASAVTPDAADEEATTVVPPGIDLGLRVYPADYRAGLPSSFDVYVSNQGPSPAGSTTLTGTFPPGEVIGASASDDRGEPIACTVSTDASTVTCAYPRLRPLRSAYALVQLREATLDTLPYRFELTTTDSPPEANPADDVVEGQLTSGGPEADLSISLLEEPSTTIDVGDEIEAAYRIANQGPSLAEEVAVDIAFPGGWSLAGASTASTSPGSTPELVTCTAGTCPLPELAAGSAIDLRVRLVAGTEGGTVDAVVGSTVADPSPSDNRAAFIRTPSPDGADLLAFVGLQPRQRIDAPVEGGRAYAFNHGPRAADVRLSVTVDDTASDLVGLPGDSGADCTVLGNVLTCTRTVPAGGDFNVGFTAVPHALGPLTATVRATSGRTDPSPDDNEASVTTQVVPNRADLRLSFDTESDPSDRRAVRVIVHNEGPWRAEDTVLTVPIADDVDLVSSGLGCTVVGGAGNRSLRCPLGGLDPVVPTASIVGTFTVSLHGVGPRSLTGTLTSATPLVNTGDDTDSVTVQHGEYAGDGCGAATLIRNDDLSSDRVHLPFALDFYGRTYDSLYVNNNGNVTFDAPLPTYTPFGLAGTDTPIIAPWFADVDTRAATGGTVSYGLTTVDGRRAFCVDWSEVGYYNRHADRTNSFRLLLIDRGAGDFDIRFDYDHLRWDTGDISGVAAAAGFSNGSGLEGESFELDGSRSAGALLDTNPTTGLVHRTQGARGVLGRFVFPVRDGRPNTDVTPPAVTGATADPPANAAGWFRGDADGEVRVTFTGTDESGPVTCATVTYAGPDSADASVTGTCTDAAGNVSPPFTFPLPYDRTAPIVDCPSAPAAGGAWRSTDVAVPCTVTDATSGVDGAASVAVTTEVAAGTASATASTGTTAALDVAGNAVAVGPFGPYAIDRADPTVVVTAPLDGATYRFGSVPGADTDCDDVGSGIVSCEPTAPIDTSVGTHTATFVATDGVGRTATASVTYRVLAAVEAGDDVAGTEGSPVSLTGDAGGATAVAWTYRAGPGVDAGTTCSFDHTESPATTFRCSDDGTFVVVLTAADGSADDSATVILGNATPTVAFAAPALGTGAVTVSAAVADAGANDPLACHIDWGDGQSADITASGGTCAAAHTYTDDADTSIVVRVADDDGASSSATRPVRVDRTAPSITITTPADGATFAPGATVLADYACTDAVAGVATCAGPVADGAAIDTTAGHHTFTVVGTDSLGNTTERTAAYDVVAPAFGDLRLDLSVLGGTIANVDACATVTLGDGSVRTACDLVNRRRDGVITFTALPAGAVQLQVTPVAAQAANYLVVAPASVTVATGTNAVPVTFRRLAAVNVTIFDLFRNAATPGCVTFTAAFPGIVPVTRCVPSSTAFRLPVGDWTATETTPFGYDTLPAQNFTLAVSPVPTIRFDHRPLALLRVRFSLVTTAASGQAGSTLSSPCALVSAADGSGSREVCGPTPNGGAASAFAEVAVPAGALDVTFRPQSRLTAPPVVTTTAAAGATTVVQGVYRSSSTVAVRLVDADTGAAISLAGSNCTTVSVRFAPAFPIVAEPAPVCANGDVFTTTLPSGPWNLQLHGAPVGFAPLAAPVAWDGITGIVTIPLRPSALRVRFDLVGASEFVHQDCATIRRGADVVANACEVPGSQAAVATITSLPPGDYTVRFAARQGRRASAGTGTSGGVATLQTPADIPFTLGADGSALVVGTYRALNRVRLQERDADTGVVLANAPAGTPCWTLTPLFTGPAPVVTCGLAARNNDATTTLPAGDWRVVLTTPAAGRVAVGAAAWNGSDNAVAATTDRPVGLRIRWAAPAGSTFSGDACATVRQNGVQVAHPCGTVTSAFVANLGQLAAGTYVVTFEAASATNGSGTGAALTTPPPVTVAVGAGSAYALGTYRRTTSLILRAVDADRSTSLRSPTQPCFELVPQFEGPSTRTVCGRGFVAAGGTFGDGDGATLVVPLPSGPWTARQVSTVPGYAVDPAVQTWAGASQTLTFRDLPVV